MQKEAALKKWIDKVGVRAVARLMKVEEATVGYWRRGQTLPRSHQMQRIRNITEGRISYTLMIDPFLRQQSESAKAKPKKRA